MYLSTRMICKGCNKEITKTELVVINADDASKMNDTVVNNETQNCSKCRNYVCCKKCTARLKLHYKRCKHPERRIVCINGTPQDLGFSYVHLPEECGGGIVYVKRVVFSNSNEDKLITFDDCKLALCVKDGLFCWIKHRPEFDTLTSLDG